MNATERWKLLRDGYRIFRLRHDFGSDRYALYELTPVGGWRKFEQYESGEAYENAARILFAAPRNLLESSTGADHGN